MKDIKLNTGYKKFKHVLFWIIFISLGTPLMWLIAIGLASYGKDTEENKEKKKGVLNLTYQKFIYTIGEMMMWLALFVIMLSVSFNL